MGAGLGHRSQLRAKASCLPQPFPAGTFVRLEFRLQQTGCRKKDWKKPECKVKPNGVSMWNWARAACGQSWEA